MVTESKKYHPSKFARFVVYPAGFIAFLLILGFILLLANGYSIEYSNNHFELQKTGMIIIASRPSEGEIYLDGKDIDKKTGFTFLPVKIQNVRVGDHTVQLVRDGYVSWEKKVSVNSSLVSWLNYIILFPKDLKTKSVDTLADKTVLTQSKNKRYLFLGQNENSVWNYYLYDTVNSELTKVWPKNTQPTEEWLKNPRVLSASFDANNDKLYLKVANGDKTDNAILETGSNGKVYSLDGTYAFDFAKTVWDAFDSNYLYVQSADKLYKLNVSSLTPAVTLDSNVVDFSIERDRNVYAITNSSGEYQLHQVSLDGTNDNTIAKGLPKDTSYKMSFSQYANAEAVLPLKEKTLITYYKLNNQITSIQLARGIDDFQWSQNGKKILYFSNSTIKSFDWETELESSVSVSSKPQAVNWYFDDAHFIVNSESGLYVIDYDGTNKISFTTRPVLNWYFDTRLSSFIFDNPDKPGAYTKYFSVI